MCYVRRVAGSGHAVEPYVPRVVTRAVYVYVPAAAICGQTGICPLVCEVTIRPSVRYVPVVGHWRLAWCPVLIEGAAVVHLHSDTTPGAILNDNRELTTYPTRGRVVRSGLQLHLKLMVGIEWS
jgi:hypothetical protein